ncbi:MAG: hypothetical protein ABR568_22270, partial [Pyrinomonadaceae bacterium]
MKTANSHSTEDDHAQALVDLSRTMNDFLFFRRTTPAARGNQAEVSSEWSSFGPLVHAIPEPEGLADYCRAVEGFRKLRPAARGDLT